MDRNTITGFILLAGLLFLWTYMNRPSEEDIAQQKREADSLRQVQLRQDSLSELKQDATTTLENATTTTETASATPDSVKVAALQGRYGAFASAANGTEEEVVLENEEMIVTFSTKGGIIKSVMLKDHYKFVGPKKKERVNVLLLEDTKNKFEYQLPINGAGGGIVKTSELYFTPTVSGNQVSLRADAGNGRYLEQIYTLEEGDSYMMDYDLKMVGLDELIPNNTETIKLNWVNYLTKQEKADIYEKQYSSIYYRPMDEGTGHLKYNGNHTKEVEGNIQWISNVQQFFNSALIAEKGFSRLDMEIEKTDEGSEDLKKYDSDIYIPIDNSREETIAMQLYVGPNEYDRLNSKGIELENIIQFGWGVFGAINRSIIRPIFSFLSRYIGSAGIVILVLTIIVKLVVYPLTYKMLHSQAKMKVLKPQIEKLKEKVGDDQQALQMEQMKLYRETGASPLGGCWPMVLQMPIWFALYRFFPASIEFRHTKFLWADDLSSYDSIWTFGEVPILTGIYGDHVSLFTLLWVITTIIYTMYNSRHMTMPNPSMKYIQYFMPIMFIFFFNNYAAGLTCYLLFSNIFNITQNLVTQNFIINHKKIEAELEANKKKPKKTSGFQARLQDAMAQQQEVQKKQDSQRKGKKGGKKK